MYKKLEIVMTGAFGSLYDLSVDFVNKKAHYEKQDAMFLDLEVYDIELSDEKIDLFSKKLDEYGMKFWDNDYRNPDFADGSKWLLNAEYDNIRKEIKGANAYPEQWDNLCKDISFLIGKRFS